MNYYQPLTIITKCSILDIAGVLDTPLIWNSSLDATGVTGLGIEILMCVRFFSV